MEEKEESISAGDDDEVPIAEEDHTLLISKGSNRFLVMLTCCSGKILTW